MDRLEAAAAIGTYFHLSGSAAEIPMHHRAERELGTRDP